MNKTDTIDKYLKEKAALRSTSEQLYSESERVSKENEQLRLNSERLSEENEQLRLENKKLKEELAQLKEQLDWLKKQLFGKKGEKEVESPPEGKTKEEEELLQTVKSYERKSRRKNGEAKLSYPEDLPIKTIFLDLPEEDKKCPITGEKLIKIGEEKSHKLAFIPGSYYIKEIIRPKYAVPNHPESGIFIREMPSSLFQKSKADESLIAYLLTLKFGDHLPLYRILESLQRDNITISRQLLSYWVVEVGRLLTPLHQAMERRVIGEGPIFVDESPVDVLIKGKKKAHQGYMWIYVGGGGKNPPYRLFDFCMDRKHCHPLEKLSEYKGLLHSDKYGAYKTLAEKGKITWIPCFAHIRRQFIESQSGDKAFIKEVIRKIRYLYFFEKIARDKSSEERLEIRQTREKPILEELIKKVEAKAIEAKQLPKSKYKKALGYFCDLIPYLKNYLDHPDAHIDNNLAERSIRPIAIGRKNWLFFGSPNGGKAGAVILSLVQSCRHLNINPREYLEDVMRKIMDHPASRVEELLPDEWAKSRRKLDSS